MRYLLSIIAAMVALCTTTTAQNIRLGEKIPDISVESVVGTDLKLIEQEYTCLIFMHSKCEPCYKAIPALHSAAAPLSDKLAVVLITHETKEVEETITKNFGSYFSTIAFDNNRHTYKAFGINFVPFGVIYNTKSRRIEWFGSVQQLTTAELNKICKTKNR
jgi:thiol-disulfide isomerase/thioredoxin